MATVIARHNINMNANPHLGAMVKEGSAPNENTNTSANRNADTPHEHEQELLGCITNVASLYT